MIFTSFNFLIFFPVVIIIYYLLPVKLRWGFLLVASYYFYINLQPVYALFLAAITLITYFFTRWMDRTGSPGKKKLILIADIILTLLPLAFLKYYNFVNEGVFQLLGYVHIRWPLPSISFLLPIGISFYTFMALGYAIDVYHEEIEAEPNLGIVALFLSFFPTILSGPIERATNMFHQFRARLVFDNEKVVQGLQFMLWGYFMKLVVADRIAIFNQAIFNNISHHNGHTLTVAVLLYPIQVYADLGGYSLIAIGAASVMGINVMQNFNRPFFSTSMAEFWRRWHISLISWLKDYIYTPLTFAWRRYKMTGIVMALMVTFIISGIWHGANLTFIIWGVMQGIFLSIEAVTSSRRKSFIKRNNLQSRGWYIFICCIFTYLLFAFSEIFGGAVSSVNNAFAVIRRIAGNSSGTIYAPNKSMVIYLVFSILLLFIVEWRSEYYKGGFSFFNNKSFLVRQLSYAFVIILILLIGVFDGAQFIYFQF